MCALGVVLCGVAHGVKVVRVVGDGVAVVVRPNVVRGVVAHGCKAAQIGAGVCPSPRLEAVRACRLFRVLHLINIYI